ncbi:MAG: outer membrane protein OmpA-like peptidoglycan-associated protein [Pseudomonadales bacterium]|jgi:outer membrane protein OmpA-like peptidoglycan-associated protein
MSSSTKSVTKSAKPTLAVVTGEESIDQAMQALLSKEEKPLTTDNVGYYTDLQYANMQQKLDDSVAIVTRNDSGINITFPGSSAFATNSDRINDTAKKALAAVASIVSTYDKTLVIVEGHTDNRGDPKYNQSLSEKRALSVGENMMTQNIAMDRIVVMGFSSTRPVSSNDTSEGRAQNRRVALILRPIMAELDTK